MVKSARRSAQPRGWDPRWGLDIAGVVSWFESGESAS